MPYNHKGYIIIWDWRFFVIVGIIILIFWIFPSTESGENLGEEIIYREEKSHIDSEAYYWNDLPIHYYFSEEEPCIGRRKSQIIKSFDIIEKETNGLVTFYEEQDDNGIEIICHKEYETEEASGYGGIEYYEGEQEILKGIVKLYKPEPGLFEYCPTYPSVVLHEILHAMGFDHIDSRRSIMNYIAEIGEACTKLDPEIINCMKHIYGRDSNYTCQDIPFIR